MKSCIFAFTFVMLGVCTLGHPLRASNGANEVSAFPPENCVSGAMMYMGWDGLHSTQCNTGQDIFRSTLGCSEGQQVVYEGSRYTCKTVATPPACGANELLTFNGTAYSCVHNDVPTCEANQVLTFNGSGFICVNRTDSIPTCAKDQFLTYNGSAFQCANSQITTWPTCASDEVLSSNSSGPICVKLPSSAASGPELAAWVLFRSDGTILKGNNVASVRKDSTAQFFVQFKTPMPDTNYVAIFSGAESPWNGQPGQLFGDSRSGDVRKRTTDATIGWSTASVGMAYMVTSTYYVAFYR